MVAKFGVEESTRGQNPQKCPMSNIHIGVRALPVRISFLTACQAAVLSM